MSLSVGFIGNAMISGPGGSVGKLWTPLLKTSSTGVGNASSGGTPASVGHSYAFGNTEEKARRLNMGCKARGQPGQPFSHKTGHGYVKAHRGFYHDAIFVKRNNCILRVIAFRRIMQYLHFLHFARDCISLHY